MIILVLYNMGPNLRECHSEDPQLVIREINTSIGYNKYPLVNDNWDHSAEIRTRTEKARTGVESWKLTEAI